MKNGRVCACWGIQQATQQNLILAVLGRYRKRWNIQTEDKYSNVYLDAGACDLYCTVIILRFSFAIFLMKKPGGLVRSRYQLTLYETQYEFYSKNATQSSFLYCLIPMVAQIGHPLQFAPQFANPMELCNPRRPEVDQNRFRFRVEFCYFRVEFSEILRPR